MRRYWIFNLAIVLGALSGLACGFIEGQELCAPQGMYIQDLEDCPGVCSCWEVLSEDQWVDGALYSETGENPDCRSPDGWVEYLCSTDYVYENFDGVLRRCIYAYTDYNQGSYTLDCQKYTPCMPPCGGIS